MTPPPIKTKSRSQERKASSKKTNNRNKKSRNHQNIVDDMHKPQESTNKELVKLKLNHNVSYPMSDADGISVTSVEDVSAHPSSSESTDPLPGYSNPRSFPYPPDAYVRGPSTQPAGFAPQNSFQSGASSLPSGGSAPSLEEIERLQRWIMLQDQLARTKRAPGHTFRKVKVSGGARVIGGNAYEPGDFAAYGLGRSHDFHDVEAAEGAMYMGDVPVSVVNNMMASGRPGFQHFGSMPLQNPYPGRR